MDDHVPQPGTALRPPEPGTREDNSPARRGDHWLDTLQVGAGGSLPDLDYDYDDVGNIEAIADTRPGKSQTLGYDALDRLTTAQGFYGTIDGMNLGFATSSPGVGLPIGDYATLQHGVRTRHRTAQIARGTALACEGVAPHRRPERGFGETWPQRWREGREEAADNRLIARPLVGDLGLNSGEPRGLRLLLLAAPALSGSAIAIVDVPHLLFLTCV